jgi:RuvB-like protein 1 (pontin 52)
MFSVAAHSHIKGLGLRQDGTSEHAGAGFVGQEAAREVRITIFNLGCWSYR